MVTRAGRSFLEDFIEEVASNKEKREVLEKFDVERYNPSFPDVKIPCYHSNYGQLFEEDGDSFMLRYEEPVNSPPLTKKDPAGKYKNDNFKQARAYLESENDPINKYLAPIVALDKQGSWIVLSEIEFPTPMHESFLEPLTDKIENMGWNPGNIDIGLNNESWVIYDYSELEPAVENWTVSEEDVLEAEFTV